MKLLEKKLKKILSWKSFWFFKSFFRWQGFEIYDYRNYQQWDDSKLINWKLSSKKQDLIVNVFRYEKDVDLNIYLDINTNWFWWESCQNFDKIFQLLDTIFDFWLKNKIRIKVLYYTNWIMRIVSINNQKHKILQIKKDILDYKISKKYISNISHFINLEKKYWKKHIIMLISDFLAISNDEIHTINVMWIKNELFLLRVPTYNIAGKNFENIYLSNEKKELNTLQFIDI